MATILSLFDRLSNVMSGMGTTADRQVFNGYNFVPITPQQAEAAYRDSWLMRKIVDIPAIDMTRNWREWQAERDQIEQLEKAERQLQLKAKIKRALILSRLWGGGALIMGVGNGLEKPELPLDVSKVGKGGLSYLHVVSRYQLSTGELIADPRDPFFGHPSYYQLSTGGSQSPKIHPSRVIAFVGQQAPEGSSMQTDLFWGDPVYQAIQTALQNADLAQDGFAGLISEAKVDVLKIPGLMKQIGSKEYEDKLLSRLQTAARGKSTWRALVLDGDEEWSQKEISWTGIPDVITTYLQMVSGAADIPITRLLGQSPKGLQSTGDGEAQDYQDMIEARQDEALSPAFDRIDEVLLRHTFGTRPAEIWWKFGKLRKPSDKETAEIEERNAKTLQAYANTGLLPSDALAEIAKNSITESGHWPGSDIAFENAEAAEDDDLPDDDVLELTTEPDPVAELDDAYAKRKRRMITDVAFNDGKVRSLYVSRRVVNAEDILAHYAAQGIEGLEPAAELHVTVIYSETAIDWMLISPDWSSSERGQLQLPPGGPRQTDLLGPLGDVLVLLFVDDHLAWRHQHMLDKGAASKWAEYQPHITIAKGRSPDLDTDAITPWQGPIILGPEIFKEIDPNR
jgi:phage-related protein (TIGR01555 family)